MRQEQGLNYVSKMTQMMADLDKTKKIGAVVVNCNPFTLGHKFLIEESSKRVDTLIVFVVSEDESVFTFNERFAIKGKVRPFLLNILSLSKTVLSDPWKTILLLIIANSLPNNESSVLLDKQTRVDFIFFKYSNNFCLFW